MHVEVESYRHSQGQIWWQLILTISHNSAYMAQSTNSIWTHRLESHNLCTMCQVHCRFQSISIVRRNLACTRDHSKWFQWLPLVGHWLQLCSIVFSHHCCV